MKKKLLTMLLVGVTILCTVGCGSKEVVTETDSGTTEVGLDLENGEQLENNTPVLPPSDTDGEIPIVAQTVADLLCAFDQIQYVDVTTTYTERDLLAYQYGEGAYLPDLYRLVDEVYIGDVALSFEEFFCNPKDAWNVIEKVGAVYTMTHDYWTAEDYEGLEEGRTIPEYANTKTVDYEAGTDRVTYQEHGCPLRYDETAQNYYFYVRFGDEEGNPTDEVVFIIETSVDDPDDVHTWGAYYRGAEDDASVHCVMHTVDDQYIMLPYLMESADRNFTYDVLK